MRGTWYYDGSWIPLETEHSKIIEEVHLRLFQKESDNQNITTCDTNTPQSYKGILFTLFILIFLNLCNAYMYKFTIKAFLISFQFYIPSSFPNFTSTGTQLMM